MSLPFPSAAPAGVLLAGGLVGALLGAGGPDRLRVCADPNNLPFSNRAGEGFENRIATLLARELGTDLDYTWWPERRGFLRNTLNAGLCDLVLGVPAGTERLRTTPPYYTSSYVFLTRRDRQLRLASLDDPRLRTLRIGIHFIGDDYQNTPPAAALARRGIVRNVTGYSIYGDYAQPNPPRTLVDAVAEGAIDVAIVWGPFAGYFGERSTVPLEWHALPPEPKARVPFAFAMTAGIRRSDTTLARRVAEALDRSRDTISAILAAYHIPVTPEKAGT